MRLFPQIGCALKHWGHLVADDGEPALRRDLAAATQRIYAERFGLEFFQSTVWSRVQGQLPVEPVFLSIGPAVIHGPEVTAWVEHYAMNGSVELQLAAMFGAIFLSDEGEGVGFLVYRLLRGDLVGGVLAATHEALAIQNDMQKGVCSRCGLHGVNRETLPTTLLRDLR